MSSYHLKLIKYYINVLLHLPVTKTNFKTPAVFPFITTVGVSNFFGSERDEYLGVDSKKHFKEKTVLLCKLHYLIETFVNDIDGN